MSHYRILVVDDSANTLRALNAFLTEEGYEVVTTKNPVKAIQIFKEGPPFDVVLSDLKMPRMEGMELYRSLLNYERNLLFIIMTAYGTIESSVKAMKEGVYDYLVKPINIDELSIVLTKALREKRNTLELMSLRNAVRERYSFHNIIGRSPRMQEIFSLLRVVSPTDATVLVTGETGTGKELITKAIHYNSSRHNGPIVCLDCAALNESLLEAELFGYVKGAFTGAEKDRIGRLEAAHRGTLFLDEVAHMSQPLQSKLLRFLQERTFEPVGGVTPRKVDVRVIAATNKDLKEEVEKGRFLPDLYYRLQLIQISVPPLRKRLEDIPLLVSHFSKAAAEEYHRTPVTLDPEVIEVMMSYPWPGNVRELSNVIFRATLLGRNSRMTLQDLPADLRHVSRDPMERTTDFFNHLPPEGVSLKKMEKELIARTLEHFNGHRSQTAEALGISRKSLYQRMRRYKMIQ